jgi:hypothetical protein
MPFPFPSVFFATLIAAIVYVAVVISFSVIQCKRVYVLPTVNLRPSRAPLQSDPPHERWWCLFMRIQS